MRLEVLGRRTGGWLVAALWLLACDDEPAPAAGKQAAAVAEAAAEKPSPGASAPTAPGDEPGPRGAEAPTAAAPPPPPPDPAVVARDTEGGGNVQLAVSAPSGWSVVAAPTKPDPTGGRFALKDALKGLAPRRAGALVARIETAMGPVHCELHEREAPEAVAQFVGLARGLRPTWDAKTQAWVERPYYDGTSFYRLIPGVMIQGGDPNGDGRGVLGYVFQTGLSKRLSRHDRPGQLCMAAEGEVGRQGQFFITERAAPYLDGKFTVFGQCVEQDVVYRIGRGTQSGPPAYHALRPVGIERVTVTRHPGGAQALAVKVPARDGELPENRTPGLIPPGGIRQVGPKK